MKEVSKTLTKVQRLEVENCVLRSRLAKIKKALDEFDSASPERIRSGAAQIECRAHIEVAFEYEDYLQEELAWAERLLGLDLDLNWEDFLQRRIPSSSPEQKGK